MPEEIMMPNREGIRLQTLLYLPEGEGPFPSLMVRCMYGVEGVAGTSKKYADEGYAVVAQNVRGRGKSEGGPTGRDDFGEDGYDTIDWMVKQQWCNGRVGTFGGSALGRVQVATARLLHPAHRAMAPAVLPYGMMSRLGGAFMFSQIPQWLYLTQSGAELNPYDVVDWMPHLYKLPVTSVLDDLGGPVEMYREVVTDPHRGYWDLYDPSRFEKLNTPNLMVTGWYDHCGTGPIDFYLATQRFGTKEQKRNTHLVIGPWDHSCDPSILVEYDFGPEANRDHYQEELRFFNRLLKKDVSIAAPAPVRIFVMGRNEWRDEEQWPLERAVETKFHLHSNGQVRGAFVRGSLSMDPPGDESPDRFTYDPANPVPTLGGANSGPARSLPMTRGPRDQRATLYRDDVLTYYSEPLEQALEVTGPLKLVLFAASSAKDTDFTAKLMDVSPDGNARILTDGIVRARFRNGLDKPQLLTPGEVVRYEIDLWNTSNEFQPGHRIALAISSSNFPRINRNLNTGGDNERESEFVSAEQTIFHDAQRASHLVLPVIPSENKS